MPLHVLCLESVMLCRAVLCPTDYAELISELRGSVPGAAHSPVVGFGGSYGGMLATWMRLKVWRVTWGRGKGGEVSQRYTGGGRGAGVCVRVQGFRVAGNVSRKGGEVQLWGHAGNMDEAQGIGAQGGTAAAATLCLLLLVACPRPLVVSSTQRACSSPWSPCSIACKH
jgi:hypothetical protein